MYQRYGNPYFGVDRYGYRYYNEPCRVQIAVPIVIVGTFIIVPLSVLVNQNDTEGGIFVNNGKFSNFGLCVKTELLRQGKEQKWLEEEVTAKTGLFVDSGYMYKILTGQRKAQKIVDAICDILGIEKG